MNHQPSTIPSDPLVYVPVAALSAGLPLGVPESWLGPVAAHFERIVGYLERHTNKPDLNELAAMVAQIPELYTEMDHGAFEEALERALGAAAVTGAMASRGADIVPTGLAADGPGVAFLPFEEAAAALDRRTAVGARLNSDQWSSVATELRNRAFFSARVEPARFLSYGRNRLAAELRLQREQLANGKTAFFSRDDFIAKMREIAIEEGIDTSGGRFDGSLRDIRSAKRLGLIYDVQTQMAEEYARFKMDLDPDVLDAFPAKRLVRLEAREHERPWPSIWAAAAAGVNWQGVARGGVMVALKTSPIWYNLGPFGNPYPPYDWGSGMGDEDVDRDEAESLGLVAPGETVPSSERVESFNRRMEAGVEDMPEADLRWLRAELGDRIEIADGVVRWTGEGEEKAEG